MRSHNVLDFIIKCSVTREDLRCSQDRKYSTWRVRNLLLGCTHICTCVVGLYSPCIHHMSTSQWQCSQALFFAAFLLLCITLNANQRTKWGRPGNEAISDPSLTLFPIKAAPSYMHTYHWSWRMSRQMAPVTELMFGCHILVTNFTCRWEDVTQNLHHCKSVWWHLASFPGLRGSSSGLGMTLDDLMCS